MLLLPAFTDLQGTKWFPELCEPSDLARVALPGLQLSWSRTSGLSRQIELWAGASHMGRCGWCVPYLLPVRGYIIVLCCSSCCLGDGGRAKGQLTALVSTAVLIYFIC